MPVKRRVDKRREDIPAEAVDWLTGGAGEPWVYFQTADDLAELWAEHGAAVINDHVGDAPGTRPVRWWTYSAPEPRRRLGGVGTPSHEVLAHVVSLEWGVPASWITPFDIGYYDFGDIQSGVSALSPRFPPLFESEAAYLDRLNLLLPGERRRLGPGDFKPESVVNILGLVLEDDAAE